MGQRPRGHRRMALGVLVIVLLVTLAVATPVAAAIEATLEVLRISLD